MAGLMTPIGMLSFPRLFQAVATAFNAEPRYSTSILFDPAAQASAEYLALKKASYDCGVNEWGENRMKDGAFVRSLKIPFHSCDEKEYEGYEPGWTYISARTKDRPGVVDGRLQDITAEADVWPGQLARLYVSPFAYDVSGSKGISFALNHVQITRRDMPRIDGRIAANRAFPAIDDPSAGAAADDMPF